MLSSLRFQSNKKYFSLIGNIFFVVLFICLSVLLFWKCKYGYVFHDEATYVSVPFRFLQGDLFFKDEHMLTQTSAFPMLPIIRLVLSINGSTEGIYLILRYAYTSIKIIVAFILFVFFRKISDVGAAFTSLCFMLFTPFSIEQFSYNSICQISFIVSLLLIYPTEQKLIYLRWASSGLFFAVAVLCCPPLIILFFIWTILVFVIKNDKYELFSRQKWLFFLIGAVSVAILFLGYVLSKITINELISSVQFILSDPDHSYSSFKPFSYFVEIGNSCTYDVNGISIPISKLCSIVYMFLLGFTISKKTKGKPINRIPIFLIVIFATIVYLLFLYISTGHWNKIIFPLNIVALFVCILTTNKTIRQIFYYFWLPGIVYSYIVNFTSNTGFSAISSASIVSLVGSIVMIVLFIKEIVPFVKGMRIVLYAFTFLLLTVQVFLEGKLHFDKTFADYSISSGDLTSKVENGSLKGIVTCDFLYNSHHDVQEDLNSIKNDSTIKSVLYIYGMDWFYLDTPTKRNSSPISYFLVDTNQNERNIALMKQYYLDNPTKKPDIVYFYGIDNSSDFSATVEPYKNQLFSEYSISEMSCGISLRK